MNKYFIYINNVVQGPFGAAAIREMLRDGKITLSTQISTGKGTPWQLVGDRQELTAAPADQAEKTAEPAVPAIFHCTHCGQKYTGDSSWLGKDIVCIKCRKVFRSDNQTAPAAAPQTTPATVNKVPAGNSMAPKQQTAGFDWGSNGSGNLICPHCWQRFNSEQMLYIASHPSLMGDSVLGASAMQRFAPIKFNAIGQALDAMNYPTNETACPRCHLRVPMSIIDEKTFYFSLVGAPSSGKSYYLATLLNTLRRTLSEQQGCTLLDVDPELNRVLANYEETIFRSARRHEVAVLPKTQQTGDDFVNSVYLDNIPVNLPKPFVYELKYHTGSQEDCNVIFYDNAGEQFEPGADNITNPGTRHLACSDGIIFIFDPLNDAIMREACDRNEPQIASDTHIYDQTRLMSEMILRIRRHRNMTANEKCAIPLVIAVGKYDAWQQIFTRDLAEIKLWDYMEGKLQAAWNQSAIMDISFSLRNLLMQYAPDLVNTAEGFFEHVILVPFSSFGCLASVSESGQLGVIPNRIRPVWTETPFLTLMAEKGLLEIAANTDNALPIAGSVMGDFIVFEHPEKHTPVRLPWNYAMTTVTIGENIYKLPPHPGKQTQNNRSQNKSTDNIWS